MIYFGYYCNLSWRCILLFIIYHPMGRALRPRIDFNWFITLFHSTCEQVGVKRNIKEHNIYCCPLHNNLNFLSEIIFTYKLIMYHHWSQYKDFKNKLKHSLISGRCVQVSSVWTLVINASYDSWVVEELSRVGYNYFIIIMLNL